jgi:hypothetical protein
MIKVEYMLDDVPFAGLFKDHGAFLRFKRGEEKKGKKVFWICAENVTDEEFAEYNRLLNQEVGNARTE